jgi:peptidoglycan/xylan/chitin deacetylase (PgdA/CDA1 family)
MAEIVYLMYHEIKCPDRDLCQSAPGAIRYAVTESNFYEQLALLKARGFRALSVSGALVSADCGPSVAITFDDGCETDLTVGVPALERFGFSATFYIVSGYIGQRGYLSGAQLRQLSDRGFEVGCHSRTHANLTMLDAAGLHEEVAVAKAEIEQLIGRKVRHFSCPGGFWSQRVARVAANAGFVTLATSRVGSNSPHTDRYRLARVAMYRNVTLARFEQICAGKGIFSRRSAQSFLDGAKMVLGDSFYGRVRTMILSAKNR